MKRLLVASLALAVAVAAPAGRVEPVALAQTTPPTFTEDVAPVVYATCASCHRSDGIAPMSLLTDAAARAYARPVFAR